MDHYAPVVSVFMITYNHEKYIEKAIESVLSQKVNFSYTIVIADDASTDTTVEIIQNYSKRFPGKFDVFFRKENAGVNINALENYQRCTSEYIAILEGDDYWIDDNKLQKQFDFMEANNELALCYTNAYKFIDGKDEEREIMVTNKPSHYIFDLDYFMNEGRPLMPTLTLFIRNAAVPKPFPKWLYNTFNLDWALNVLFMQNGKAGYIDELTATYRRHVGGIIISTPLPYVVHNGIQLAKNLDKHFNFKYHHVFGKIQWRYLQLVIHYFEKKKYGKGIFWLLYSFFRNPKSLMTNVYYLKTLYKVIFQGHESL